MTVSKGTHDYLISFWFTKHSTLIFFFFLNQKQFLYNFIYFADKAEKYECLSVFEKVEICHIIY